MEGGAILVEKSYYQDCLWPLRNNQTDVRDRAFDDRVMAIDTTHVMHDGDAKQGVLHWPRENWLKTRCD
jgi:hypothetical protein